MKLSENDIKRYRAAVQIQKGCEIATISAFVVICVYLFGYIEADLAMTMLGVDLFALSILYVFRPTSESQSSFLKSVINSDPDNIRNNLNR